MNNIVNSVGFHGDNHPPDVTVVQTLLNACLSQLPPRLPQPLTGICDPTTIEVIRDFQLRVIKSASPDGRVDPGGRTLAALNIVASGQPYLPATPSPPASDPGKKFTTNLNEFVTARTTPSAAQVVDLLKRNWTDLTEAGARTLTAQFMHETGGGKYCFNWNLGNVKAGPNEAHMYLKNVWEVDSPAQANAQVAKSGGLGRIATPDEIKTRGWSCPVGSNVVVFDPPHPQCRFRAYISLEEGAQKWMSFHKKIALKNPSYITELNRGDCAAVANSLKKVGYYTGDENDYASSMISQKARIDKSLGLS